MPPEVDADMWRTVLSGEPWRGLVKYSGKDGGYFWCIANVTPVMEGGKNTGFMSVCTKPKREQIEQAAQLYRTLKGNNPDGVRIVRGAEAARGWRKFRNALRDITLAQRLALSFGSMALLALLMASHALFDFADSTLIAWRCWQRRWPCTAGATCMWPSWRRSIPASLPLASWPAAT
jgi:aerotaxis receptor